MSRTKRAVGLIRVSRVKGRDKKDALHSPVVQRERIEDYCRSHGWKLVDVLDENEGANGALRDASGAKSLAERPKLREAVERIEAGRASVLVVAYADRLTWTLSVRDEVLNRIEAVDGGEVWSVDFGKLSNGTAVDEFTGTSLTAARRLVIRQAADKARDAQVEAVERGTWMSPGIPAGYVLDADRRLTPDPKLAPIVREAFERRADGARIDDVRAFLASHAIERTRAGVAQLLRNRAVLGELHFGELHNPEAHPAIVDRATFERVQRVTITRGRMPKSDRLLSRLGVLVCDSCGGRLSINTSNYRYRVYRCGNPDCAGRATISASLVEEHVVNHVKLALAGIEETAHADAAVNAAAAEVEHAERRYQAFVAVLDPTRPEEVEKLRQARDDLDAARLRHEDAKANLDAATVAVSVEDWNDLTPDEQRALIRAVVERVEVRPGRRPDRLTFVSKGSERKVA
jgi:site-specific DNA recombinase